MGKIEYPDGENDPGGAGHLFGIVVAAVLHGSGWCFTTGDQGDGTFALVGAGGRYFWRRVEKKARTSFA
ncbi:hypothetical protein ABGB17_15205 [Sphaerisporangium sp. B11E5]|uniref:hypothetical protein n=1 Tax=Sphaerisporangium sp. B11E5 TaxID=3153563 RepID=UPI00325CD5B3